MRLPIAVSILGLMGGFCAFAQSVISAHSGVIHYIEGRVLVDGNPIDLKFGQFPELKVSQQLRTEDGRAEILLTPGAFLRVGENSEIRMLSNQLTDTRIEVLSGSAMVECEQMPKDNGITLLYQGNAMLLEKAGLYRVDSDPPLFRVYEGQAIVRSDSGQLTLKTGKETRLDGVLAANSFDNKSGDELYRWASRRSSYVATANVSAARSAYTNDYGSYSGYDYGYGGFYPGGWSYNPWFGMFTFIPYSGILYSPFGYSFWSPYSAFYYAPQYFYYGGGGYGGSYYGGSRSTGHYSPTGRLGGGSSGRPVSVGRVGSHTIGSGGFGHGSFSGGGHMGGFSSGGGHSGGGHR